MGRSPGVVLPLLLVISLATAGGGCLKKEGELEKTVREYNDLLQSAYAAPNARLMEEVATTDEIRRIDLYISYNLKQERILDARLIELEVTGEDKGAGEATVTTQELWRYRYLDRKTRRPRGETESASYRVTYRLVNDRGKWLVSSLEYEEKGKRGARETTGWAPLE